jgi:hypothetical protein
MEYTTISESEYNAVKAIREKGYAVVIFNPEELQGVKPRSIEDDLVLRGWESIDALKGFED